MTVSIALVPRFSAAVIDTGGFRSGRLNGDHALAALAIERRPVYFGL
jgi:hypothetical protein